MFSQINCPHAALADLIPDDIRTESKAPIPPGQQQLRLECREHAAFDQKRRRLHRIFGEFWVLLELLVQRVCRADTTFPNKVQQFNG